MPDEDTVANVDEDGLYVVAPEHFIAARDALVRRLRSSGAKAEAAEVAKRRRPPLTAWALNQVARTVPTLVEDLLEAGVQLRAATERALSGDASGLRPARAAERSAVDAVVAEAVQCLEAHGSALTDVMRPRMEASLRAAVVDESVADRLRRGVLEGDRDAPGFGMDALAPPAPAPAEPGPVVLSASEPVDKSHKAEVDVEAAAAEQAARAQRYREAQADAVRLAAEAEALVAEADRLADEAKQAGERATNARALADEAVHAAAVAAESADALAK